MLARVVAVSVSSNKGEPKYNVGSAFLLPGVGIEGDVHAAYEHRQVSFLALESIEKMRQAGLTVGPGDFAENITTVNLDLTELSIGTRLKIGKAVLEISQIGQECHTPCAIYYQAGACVMPHEGVFATVETGGKISVGDAIEVS